MAIPYYSMDINRKELGLILGKLVTGRTFHSPQTDQYAKGLKQAIGAQCIVPTPSGRTAFYFLLDQLFKSGDEILLSAFSFPLFAKMMIDKGLHPVFVDVKPNGLINEDLIEQKITKKTRGLLLTHLFGNASDMDRIVSICKKYNLYLLEDCAHSFGSTYKNKMLGTFGKAAVFSTSPMKVPTTLGGGLLVTDDKELSDKFCGQLESSSEYQYKSDKMFKLLSYSMVYYLNSYPALFSVLTSRVFQYLNVKNPGKLRQIFYSDANFSKPFNPYERIKFTGLQASIGVSQIGRYQDMIARRRKFADIYNKHFAGSHDIKPVVETKDCHNNFLYYIIDVNCNVDQLIDQAIRKGLFLMREDGWYCPKYSFAKDQQSSCPNGAALFPRLVRLPNSSLLKEKQINEAADILMELVQKLRS